jgi:hypothetical protein
VAEALDAALKVRLRAVLDSRPVTEAELRKLFEEGRACELILGAQLEKEEARLVRFAAEPASEFAEIAEALRRVGELRPDLAELHELLAALDTRAREFRSSWVGIAGGGR